MTKYAALDVSMGQTAGIKRVADVTTAIHEQPPVVCLDQKIRLEVVFTDGESSSRTEKNDSHGTSMAATGHLPGQITYSHPLPEDAKGMQALGLESSHAHAVHARDQ